jgi:hypothetical protein
MSIQKKSLVSSLKTTKKANVASASMPEGSQKFSKSTKSTKIMKARKVATKMLSKRAPGAPRA